ncbi:hypothetical protein PVK06_048223 [Gossypium arboreum]|uniref:Uncharacterized protein n=1 Tax=Gossypium arboreum TaxID=29729 RepID=A0ABR0MFU9_GOSAR|nr:hypothetical protein PVK06_048223 [Gossypium arboreum]
MQADKIILEEMMKSMGEQYKLVVANLEKNHEEALKKYKVSFDALNHLMGAQLDFDIRFQSGATWEEFVEEWKNSSKLYFADTPAETSVVPTTRCEGNTNE